MKTPDDINWKRLYKALSHDTNNLEKVFREPGEIVELLKKICPIVGEHSLSRQMIYFIGRALLLNTKPKLIVPVCPDYTHSGGLYDFQGLNNGISLLASKQEQFVKELEKVLPIEVHFLIADQEACDKRICSAVRKTKEEFQASVEGSLAAMKSHFSRYGWHSHKMTEFLPELTILEKKFGDLLVTSDEVNTVKVEAVARSEMYDVICSEMSDDEKFNRTIRTSAQYLALGVSVAKVNDLVANHTTVNLRYYNMAGAAVLHNPVKVY